MLVAIRLWIDDDGTNSKEGGAIGTQELVVVAVRGASAAGTTTEDTDDFCLVGNLYSRLLVCCLHMVNFGQEMDI